MIVSRACVGIFALLVLVGMDSQACWPLREPLHRMEPVANAKSRIQSPYQKDSLTRAKGYKLLALRGGQKIILNLLNSHHPGDCINQTELVWKIYMHCKKEISACMAASLYCLVGILWE